jgi:hypothetical protein
MVEFANASIQELVRATQFLHHIKPSLRNKLVYAIEKAQTFDRNVVFHLTDKENDYEETDEVLLLSSDYILDHPYWKGNS